MPMFIFIILATMLTLNLAWAIRAHRLVATHPHRRWLRAASWAFAGLQLAMLAWLFLGRTVVQNADAKMPETAFVLLYAWNMLILPVLLAGMIAEAFVRLAILASRGVRGLWRWTLGLRGSHTVETGASAVSEGSKATSNRTVASDTARRSDTAKASGCVDAPDPKIRLAYSAPASLHPPSAPVAVPLPITAPDPVAEPALDPYPAMSRRNFLAATAMAPAAVAILTTGVSRWQLDHFRIRRITVPLAGLPRDLDGLRIAHLSDVHVGDFTNGKVLARVTDAVNSLRADLAVMTGDLINRRISDLPAGVAMLRAIDSPNGLWVCEGNHDLFEGRRAFEHGVLSAGIPILINDTRTLRIRGVAVQILGLRWGHGDERRDGGDDAIAAAMAELLPQRDPDAFGILLAHHPHAFDLAAEAGIPLTLSGHTHGGQLMASPSVGFGPWMYRYWSGLYEKRTPAGHAAAVVSNGTGNWFPIRVNAPAEIIELTLKRA